MQRENNSCLKNALDFHPETCPQYNVTHEISRQNMREYIARENIQGSLSIEHMDKKSSKLVGVIIGSLNSFGDSNDLNIDYESVNENSSNITCSKESLFGYIAMLVVHPEYRRLGIGRQLVDHLLVRYQSIPSVVKVSPLYICYILYTTHGSHISTLEHLVIFVYLFRSSWKLKWIT